MLTREENELLTRTGKGTPMGELLRRYWIPAVFSKQLPGRDAPPVRVRLLGEKLVAFRDSSGRPGLFDERCPHRGASMFFGRNEENGLRCVYHGWKFDIDGRCVDMPSEPAESNFKNKVSIEAYPCVERGGVIWAYMGRPALRPAFPDIEWTLVPESQRYVTRHIQECNFFQALEGGFDNSHVAFLHRGDGSARPGVPRAPHVGFEAVSTDYGFVVGGGRPAEDGRIFWTASMFLMPLHKLISRVPMDGPIGAHVWVPMDDETCMNWTIEYHPDRPFNEREIEQSRSFRSIHPQNIPGTDYPVLNPHNDYLVDRALQIPAFAASASRTPASRKAWARSRTARASTSVRATRPSCRSGASSSARWRT
jgi:phthalate 4,5-dioxygenase